MQASDPPQGQDNVPNHTDDAPDGGALVNPPLGITGNPPPVSEHGKASQNTSRAPWWRRLDAWRFIAEVIILAVTIRIAFIYSGQLCQMIESNTINRESVETVQRAFLSFNRLEAARVIDPMNPREHS